MREWAKKRQVARSYDRSAAVYDAQYADEQGAKIRTALSRINLREDYLMLDVGCGTGLLFEHIGGSARLLVGLDLSSGVLKEARRRARRFPRTALVRADADFMPFPNGVFDVVFAITLLQNMPNFLSTLHEMKRVRKNRSILVVTGLKKGFSQKVFLRMLEEAGLRASFIKTNSQLKGHIALCRKHVYRKISQERFEFSG